MPKKAPTMPSGPRSMFKKRSSLGSNPMASLRSSSWSVPEMFKASSIDDFVVEELGGRSGNLVYGPVSVFNGSVSLTAKAKLPSVTVSVTFRGLTEFNGKPLAFFNVTDHLWTGDLEPGPKNFLFAFKFPPVNLPPTSTEPYIDYQFVAQIKTALGANVVDSLLPADLKVFTSKPHQLTFMPYVDPFAKQPVAPKLLPPIRQAPEVFIPPAPTRSPTGGRPMLRLTTENLPPSPTLLPTEPKTQPTPMETNPSSEKTAVILDGNGRIMAKLKVLTSKTKFVPGDEVKVTVILTLPKGVAIPKNYHVKIVERRALGFATDEDADLADNTSEDGHDKARRTSAGKIFNRVLTQQKYPFARVARPIENRPSTSHSNDGLDNYVFESGIEIVETLSVRLPSFKTFIDKALLPSASLPLGPSARDIALATPVTPLVNPAPSIKGKEIIRPASAPRPLTGTTIHSNRSGSSTIHGLHYIVAHFLTVTVPLFSGTATSLIRKTSGTLEVDVSLILGNRTPDIYGYQSHSVTGSMEKLKVSTPELVVVPPGEAPSGLSRQSSKASFRREPSPLRGLGLGVSAGGAAYGNGNGNGNGNGHKYGYGGYGHDGASEGSAIYHPLPVLRNRGSRLSFRSIEAPAPPIPAVKKWKKGDKFPTLEDTDERPGFLSG
ncbi:hypothetical protein DFH27DRAFT_613819 [Peziza echinospora]|nr:hypothetical protein DFH27DRAFT_613819 [Peziza echinospora]